MYEIKLYVGVGQDGHIERLKRVNGICEGWLEGFTFEAAQGYYKGRHENAAVITYITHRKSDIELCQGLKGFLKAAMEQESILMTVGRLDWIGGL